MTFLDALTLGDCKPKLVKGMQQFPCGLYVAVDSIKVIPANSYVSKKPAILRAAHLKHHDHAKAKASLGFQSVGTERSNHTLITAWCSCEDADALRS